MTIGLLAPVFHRGTSRLQSRVRLAPVRKPLPDTLDGVVDAVSRVPEVALLSAAIEPASGRLRIELIGAGTHSVESRVRLALGGFERPLAIEWVSA